MTPFDKFLQRARMRRALPYITAQSRVLDIGSHDGVLLRAAGVRDSVGIDPTLAENATELFGQLVAGNFPDDLTDDHPFDVITALAVLEHIPSAHQASFARACARFLRPGGRLVLTVPSPAVDTVLAGLRALRLVDGMSLEEHYGFDVTTTPALFEAAGLSLERHARFQLGLNNLFVFTKAGARV